MCEYVLKIISELRCSATAISAKNMNILAVFLSLWHSGACLALHCSGALPGLRPELAATLLAAYIEKEIEKELE